MKLIVAAVLALVVAAALAAPAEEQPKILRSDFEQSPEGNFKSSFETDNGIVQEHNGELKEVNDEENKPQQVIVLRGSYSYQDPEGQTHTVTYYADETGFHAESADIPKAA